jgi:hypothetical protein
LFPTLRNDLVRDPLASDRTNTLGQRVHLIVELVDERPVDRAAAIAKLRSATSEMHFRSTGRLPTRDDLHER